MSKNLFEQIDEEKKDIPKIDKALKQAKNINIILSKSINFDYDYLFLHGNYFRKYIPIMCLKWTI